MLTGSVSRGNGGRYYYYHCYSKACVEYGKAIAKGDLEAAFAQHLRRITPKPRVLNVIRASVIQVWEEHSLAFRSEAERHAAALTDLTAKRDRIRELLEDGTYSGEEGKERLAEVKNRITATEISLNEARMEQFDVEGAITYATSFLSDLGRQWFDLMPELRPRFQKLIFPAGVPYSRSGGFGTAKLGLIFELCQQNAADSAPLVDLCCVGWNQLHEELREWLTLKAVSTHPA